MLTATRAEGQIADCIRNGQPLGHIPVIDFHSHLGSSSDFYYIPASDPDSVVAYMDRFGVDHMVTFTIGITSDMGVGNELQYAAMQAYPDRFTSLVTLHAAFPDDWRALLERGAAAGARGIKLISQYQGVHEPDIDWSGPFDFARERHWVVLHHSWHSPERLGMWAGRYGELAFICGHATRQFAGAFADHDNVYMNTSAEFANVRTGSFEILLETFPHDRILYGSDALDLDFGTAIGPLALLDVDETIKEKILGGNAVALMKQQGWNLPFLP